MLTYKATALRSVGGEALQIGCRFENLLSDAHSRGVVLSMYIIRCVAELHVVVAGLPSCAIPL